MFSKIDKDILLEYAETIKPYLEKDNEIKKRTEGSVISFFIEDKPTYDKISQHMFRWISEVHEPGSQEDLDFLLANGAKKILVDEIPYGKYNYKVTLKCDLAVNRRSDFFSWLSKYTEDTFKVSKETARWLKNERKWSADPFIYVSNSSMLTMMGMYVSGHIRRIDQYVLRSSIHTE
jgi:hypothetical protein